MQSYSINLGLKVFPALLPMHPAPVVDGAGNHQGLVPLVQTGHGVKPGGEGGNVQVKELLDQVLGLKREQSLLIFFVAIILVESICSKCVDCLTS